VGRRLAPAARRDQILDVGAEQFAAQPYEQVHIADVAALAGDPLIEGIISEELAELRRRMLNAGGLHGRERVRASIALSGWLAFVRAVCVEWLADPDHTLTREEVREMCLGALLSALGEAAPITTPALECPR
jgi:hypothetical protein